MKNFQELQSVCEYLDITHAMKDQIIVLPKEKGEKYFSFLEFLDVNIPVNFQTFINGMEAYLLVQYAGFRFYAVEPEIYWRNKLGNDGYEKHKKTLKDVGIM